MKESKHSNQHIRAVLQALLVTFLWSTSWVLIKIGLKTDLPSITFAGLRYTLAFFCLIPFVILNPDNLKILRGLSIRSWVELTVLGVAFYTITQGAQFVSLALLPAATLSLLMNFSPVLIAFYGSINKHEPTSALQWVGIFLTVLGAIIYFLPLSTPTGQILGLMAALVGLLANSGSAIYGRYINSNSKLSPIIVTAVSMGIGGLLLLMTGYTTQGFGTLNTQQWLIIGWLALINTAFAFTLWNRTLQTLTAVESSIINGTMLPQIAILAWLFLDEPLNIRQILGIICVGIGTLIVQLWRYFPVSKNIIR
ncbi:MAG: DMT family transporter [Anaerolineales bacterium]|nr:DMT family transporter [Anaerolineales bacterium]